MLFRSLLVIGVLLSTMSVPGQGPSAGMDLSNYGVRIEPDKKLMVVLATLEMAEIQGADGKTEKLLNTPLSEKGTAFREQLRRDFVDLPGDLRRKISTFVQQHKKIRPRASDAELVAPF